MDQRTDWPDWRLDNFSSKTERDASRLGEEVDRLREELADRREEEWERRRRRSELVMKAILCLLWALVIANIVLASVAPKS